MFEGVGQRLARADSLAWNKQAEVVATHYCHCLLVRFCIRRRVLVKGARQADLRYLKNASVSAIEALAASQRRHERVMRQS